MEKYLIEHGTYVPRPVIQLFRSLPDLSGDEREEEHAHDYTQANHPRHRWAKRSRMSELISNVKQFSERKRT